MMAERGKKRVLYSEEYKKNAVKMHIEDKKTMAAVSRELGIGENTVRSWVRAAKSHPDKPFVGSGRLHPEDARMKTLEKENRDLREENEILKKAAAIFATMSKK
jgi:transposase